MKSIGRLSFTLLGLGEISIIATTTAASANEGGSIQVVSSWPKSAQPIRCSGFGGCRPIVQCTSYTIDSYLMGSGGFFSPRRKLQPLIRLMRYEDRGENHACVHNLTGMLPLPISSQQYYQLFTDALVQEIPSVHPRLKPLGYDLSDETWTSSLLNCGRWESGLASIAQRVNQYGLLSFEDAQTARKLLPDAWCNSPHSFVTIWALFEVLPPINA